VIDQRLLRLSEVKRLTGLSRATLYRLQAAGQFPRQVKLGARASAWVQGAVLAWIAARIEAAGPAAMYPNANGAKGVTHAPR
jgi:prophage regulatory protein